MVEKWKKHPQRNPPPKKSCISHMYRRRKMIEATEIPLFVLCTGSLTAAFVYYNIKYRKFLKENATAKSQTMR
jgi:hypothetical protein